MPMWLTYMLPVRYVSHLECFHTILICLSHWNLKPIPQVPFCTVCFKHTVKKWCTHFPKIDLQVIPSHMDYCNGCCMLHWSLRVLSSWRLSVCVWPGTVTRLVMDCYYCMHVSTVVTLILRFKLWFDGEI